MPIYSPTGFLDITNATLRTSNTECQNLKIGTGNLYVTSEISPSYELNLSNVTSLGATSPHTLTLSNVTTAIDATSNIITSGNLKIGGLIYTKDWGIRAASGSNDLYVGRFTVHGITEVLITDQGASLGSASKFTITRNVSSTPLVNGIDSSSTINYEWYFKSHDSTTYDLWVRPTATVQTNIKVTSSTYIDLESEPSSSGAIACANGLINMSGNVVASQNLTVTGNATVSENLTVSGNVSDLNVVSNVNMLHTSNTASIKLNSNVVTEFPRSKKLIKYPRVAMTQDDESLTTGYVADASTEETNNTGPWKAFNGDGSAWETTPQRFSPSTGDWDGTTTAPYAISLVGGTTIYGEWVELKIPNKIQLHTCRIAPMTHSTYTNLGKHRSPRDGYILGRVGATGNWTVLKSWSGLIGGWEDLVLRDFDIENPLEYYDYFRVVWTAINGNNNYSTSAGAGYASSGEIEFLGVPEYDPDAHGTDVTVKSYPNVPNTDWLEVYYDAKGLGAGTVTTVNDLKPSSLGSALNSTATNNITVADDAFVFNGTDSYIKIQDLTNPSGAWVHSVTAWVKFTDFDSIKEVSWIGDSNSVAATRQSFSFQTGGETVTMGINGSNVQFRFASPLTTGKWHHVVYTYNGGSAGLASTAYQVFIDGVEASKFNGVGTGTLTLPADSAIWIGTTYNTSNYFGGSIANFRLFNRALTSDEIDQLYAYQKEDFGHGNLSMTLKAGRLGIGTSEPRAALDVRGGVIIQSMISDTNGFYEEGEWTPYIAGSTSGVCNPSSTNYGWFIRVGNLVTIGGTVAWSGYSGAITGNRQIMGLPYTARNIPNARTAMSFGVSTSTGLRNNLSGGTSFRLIIDPGKNFIYIGDSNESYGAWSTYNIGTTMIDNDGIIYGLGGTYRI